MRSVFLLSLSALLLRAQSQGHLPSSPPSEPYGSRASAAQVFGFELEGTSSMPAGWRGSPSQTIALESTSVHSGHRSVRLQRASDSPGHFSVLSMHLPVDFTGKRIELRGYLRTQDVSGFAGLWLREDGRGAPLALENMQTQALKGTNGWKLYTITLPLLDNANDLYLGVLSAGTGTTWADDLELLIDGKPIAEAPAKPQMDTASDHTFDGGSHIQIDQLTPTQIRNLATLGRVWGFLKYHHPFITSGQRQWDYDLLRILPEILNANSAEAANAAILRWIDALGPIPACHACAHLSTSDLQLAPDLDWTKDLALLGAPLSARLQQIYANRTISAQFYVSLQPNIGNPIFDHEPTYDGMALPDAGFQLLALFRFWNILQYWSPNRVVAQENWPEVLREFIPRVVLAKDKPAYELALLDFAARVHDTHTNLWSSLAVRPPTGTCSLPVNVRLVGECAVVTSYSSTKAGSASKLKQGDILESIDGMPVRELIRTWTPHYADSNTAARLRDIALSLTDGPCGPANLQITRDRLALPLTSERRPKPDMDRIARTHDLPGPTFRLLSNDVAYLKLSSIEIADISHYMELARNTKGLIVDIRNYPSQFVVFALGSLLASHTVQFVTFTKPDESNPGAFFWKGRADLQPAQPHYGGKVVILVDETSQSQSEYTAMALRSTPNAIIVGSTTAGADGNVSAIPLPGGLHTSISGIGVFYPDKRPTQRIGIVPDIVKQPTLQGLADGRDEVLEVAIRQVVDPSVSDIEVQHLAHP